MGKKQRTVLIALLAMALGSLVWLALGQPREPIYKGKLLSAWLDEYNHAALPITRDPAKTAILQIGTNGVPVLLRLASTKDSVLWEKLRMLVARQKLIPFHLRTAGEYRDMALVGFEILGPAAKPAVPGLIGLLKDQNWSVRGTAMYALGRIGPEAAAAVPALIEAGGNTNIYTETWMVTMTLTNIHREPSLVVPFFMEQLRKIPPPGPKSTEELAMWRTGPAPRWFLAVDTSIVGLGRLGSQARTAVPALLPLLTYEDYRIRTLVTNTLEKIDPEAAAKAGIP